MEARERCDCYQCELEREVDKIDTNTKHLFPCTRCEGKGKVYDSTVLLRWEPCRECKGGTVG